VFLVSIGGKWKPCLGSDSGRVRVGEALRDLLRALGVFGGGGGSLLLAYG
jgi:hypothetical protein